MSAPGGGLGDLDAPARAGQRPRRGWLAARRAARAAQRARWFTVDPWGQDRVADRALVRALLQALRPWADQVQSDLPMIYRARWPQQVAAAADHLAAVSPRHRGDRHDYATTGWLPAGDEGIWRAFVLFAPYALGSDVLSADARALVGLADEGTSLALRLSEHQQHLATAVLGGRRLRALR